MRIGVVGTGRMGAAMVGRLRAAGHEVTVFNRTTQRAERVASQTGAQVAHTARQAAAGAEFVIVSLADDAAVRQTYGGPDGLVEGLRSASIVLDTSTVAPQTIRDMAELVEARGAGLLDTPVSGSVSLVERGELTVLVGGRVKALERARPVLMAFATNVFHLGGQGAGATMKLAVNAVVIGLNQALAEALVLAERAGIDRAAAYEVFAASAVAAPFVGYKRDSFLRPDQAPVAFALDLVAKDQGLIADLAALSGAPMTQLAANRRVVDEALAAGYGGRDLSVIAEFLRATGPPRALPDNTG